MGTEESDKPDPLSHIEDSLEWERPTQQRIRSIEETVDSVPPASVGRRWTPAGVVLVMTAFGAMCVTAGGALGPLLMKPDLSGYVKREELMSCQARIDERGKAHEEAIDRERARTTACFDKLGTCQSQRGAQDQVIESLETKQRR